MDGRTVQHTESARTPAEKGHRGRFVCAARYTTVWSGDDLGSAALRSR
jgi:hypothetical protein